MSESAHAIYSPSSIYRNISCVGSLALIKKLGAVGKTSEYAAEGTLYHDWISKSREAVLAGKKFDYDQVEKLEMREYVKSSTEFALGLLKQFKKLHDGVEFFIEQRVKFDDELWGTADLIFRGYRKSDKAPICVIVDDKYGKGVEVEAEDNEQLVGYGLCYQNQLDLVFEEIHFFIYQPRTPGKEFSRWSVTKDVMSSACVAIMKNKKKCMDVLKFFNEKGTLNDSNLVAGSHCRFCPAKLHGDGCPKYLADLQSTQLKILDDVPEVPALEALSTEQKLEIFKRRKMFTELLKEIGQDLLAIALKEGLEGFKIVPSQQRRTWPKGKVEDIAKELIALGVDDPIKKSLIGIGEVEKQIGTGKLEKLTELSKPGYQLVPDSDKRQAIKQIGLEDLGEIEL